MGFFSKFERKVEDGVEGAASALERSALTPVQITKKAEKQMKKEKMVGSGKQIAPTLYTVLVSEVDDSHLSGYYPTLAGEVETYLIAKADDLGYKMDGKPLVRFIPDPSLRSGKFDVIAELVAAPTVAKLRAEENARYGIATPSVPLAARPNSRPAPQPKPAPLVGNRPNVAQVPNAVSVNKPAQVPNVQSPKPQGTPSRPILPEIDDSGLDVVNTPEPAQNYAAQGADQQPTQLVDSVPAQGGAQACEVYFYDEDNDIAYQLTGASEKIGRESANDIVVNDINASRVHAEIHMEPNGTWIISDMGSTNGLYINGRRVKSAPLSDADIVLIGTTRLEFQLLG